MAEGPSGPQRCPFCTAPVAPDSPSCSFCGKPLPAPGAAPQHLTALPESVPAKRRGRPAWLIPLLAAAALVTLVGIGVLAYLIAADELRWLLRPSPVATLVLEPRGADGTVSGSYRAGANVGGGTVVFSVTPDGKATFREKDAPSSQVLAVSLTSELTASMTWAGVTIDGIGVPTAQERGALDELATRQKRLFESLALIPLDLSCKGAEVVSEKQVAALLFPLQMRFKYLVPDRTALARQLLFITYCDYDGTFKTPVEKSPVILLTPAMPVPVVPGYFPFDQDGAAKLPASLAPWSDNTCQGSSAKMAPLAAATGGNAGGEIGFGAVAKENEFGPCNAMCRGACGPDCTQNNCTLSTLVICDKDAEGRNTGYVSRRVLSYDCGLHPGCIEHDACYDSCNSYFGCGTWDAAFCRHGRVDIATVGANLPSDILLRGYSFCDFRAWSSWGAINSALWIKGYGHQPIRRTFVYTTTTTAAEYNPVCVQESSVVKPTQPPAATAVAPTRAPATTAVRTPVAPTKAPAPTPVSTPVRTPAPAPTPSGLVWVLQGTPVVNVNKDPTRVVPPEPKYAGSVSEMSASAAGFTTHERSVVDSKVLYDFTITCNFAAPPGQLAAGRPITLTTTCLAAGSHTSGGEGLGEQFWYTSPTRNVVSPADVLRLYPWAPRAASSASKTWTITPPAATRAGATFQVTAGLWNRPPCNVTWTYRTENR